ncbi:MAG TPA: TIGR03667 family PPOX class F420-dependent oxidoreductase [Candidatus Limnocylindrales bacterium]|nr:TIGR03667 family PPOX class F420-dependent oxidoreductase [Candidatus Limnocylindrales bacterium]
MVFDSGSGGDAHALERLERDMIAWLTTVTPDGQPQTFPIWFLWDAGEILVYSDRRAKRNGNIGVNPRVSLHLGDNGQGGDIVIVEGEARVDDETPRPEDNTAYNAKYADWIRDFFTTAEEFTSVYNVPIRIRPTRGRAFGA